MERCKHEHLRFEDGTLYLVCIDCNRLWGSVDFKGGNLNFTHMADDSVLPPFHTRHDRWTLPRTKRVK